VQLVHEPKQAKCSNHALILICHTPTTETKIFSSSFFLFVFSSRDRILEFLWGLAQTIPSLIPLHVIVGHDHRPYQKGAFGFCDSRNRNASVPLFSVF
jgi:hypothetical protein